MNAAVHLPVTALGPDKFTARPQTQHDSAEHVLVNTELSMFGKNILPTTRWDEELNSCHRIPDYQPFEYLISGAHLGEILRLILVEMAAETGFLGGELPLSLQQPYSICPQTMAIIEADNTPTLAKACAYVQDKHSFPTPPTAEDLRYIQAICRCVSRRAAIYLAAGIHALEIGAGEVRLRQERIGQGRACKVGVRQRGAAQPRARQVGTGAGRAQAHAGGLASSVSICSSRCGSSTGLL